MRKRNANIKQNLPSPYKSKVWDVIFCKCVASVIEKKVWIEILKKQNVKICHIPIFGNIKLVENKKEHAA